MKNIILIISTFVMVGLGGGCFGQASISGGLVPVRFYFRISSDLLLKDYRGNTKAFDRLDQMLLNPDLMSQVDSIKITGSTSPEGGDEFNRNLSEKRSEAFLNHLHRLHSGSIGQKIFIYSVSENWQGLRELVEMDVHMPMQSEVLRILDSSSDTDVKQNEIARLDQGRILEYMQRNIYPYLRFAMVSFVPSASASASTPASSSPSTIGSSATSVSSSSQSASSGSANVDTSTQKASNSISDPSSKIGHGAIKRPLLALKTNLLFDAASALNVEFEVPIGSRWSVAGEWIFPWWLWEKRQYCLELINANIEGRYWFNQPNLHPRLTGWFVGVYAGAGKFDLEWGTKGYQVKPFYGGGLTGGYAHTIGRNFRMEYSLGAGYMESHYEQYIPINGGAELAFQKSGTHRWLGLTRAKVSLVWMLTRNSKIK